MKPMRPVDYVTLVEDPPRDPRTGSRLASEALGLAILLAVILWPPNSGWSAVFAVGVVLSRAAWFWRDYRRWLRWWQGAGA